MWYENGIAKLSDNLDWVPIAETIGFVIKDFEKQNIFSRLLNIGGKDDFELQNPINFYDQDSTSEITIVNLDFFNGVFSYLSSGIAVFNNLNKTFDNIVTSPVPLNVLLSKTITSTNIDNFIEILKHYFIKYCLKEDVL